ncbi:MAG: hypothetical protein H5T69_13295, partial [Chloroflexi bacterium]|nr:hypothetical protein [Chloroflexota bacterium]
MERDTKQSTAQSGLAIGLLLIAVGLLLILGRLLGVRLGTLLWPFFILIPGALLLLIGLL